MYIPLNNITSRISSVIRFRYRQDFNEAQSYYLLHCQLEITTTLSTWRHLRFYETIILTLWLT